MPKFTRPKPIKPFKTLDEEADFWDTHDTSPLLIDPSTPLEALPLIEPEKDSTVTLRLQKSVKDKIQQIARSKGINFSTLSRLWLVEKLHQYQRRSA